MVTCVGADAWTRLNADAEALTGEALQALSPMVILAPHPDDETLGCGGLLATAAAEGLQPRVVYLTDGSASHRKSALWPSSRLAETRRGEALAALSVLGVEAGRTLFLNWPDSAPHRPGEDAYESTFCQLSTWLDGFDAKSLWAPRRGEAHCDHAAATDLADDLAAHRPRRLRRLDYMVWGWADDGVAARRLGEKVWRLPCAELALRRRLALACHRTQTSDLIADAEEAFLIPPDLAALTDRPAEIFIERPPRPPEKRS
jgi:LmbE family N-acetylglucosaminyl deacetylase